MKNIFVVTHAQATHHLDKIVGGWFDSSLTAHGQSQAIAIAKQLTQLVTAQSPTIISSDLKRALQTADIIAQHFNTTSTANPNLREISYGKAEGKPQAWLDAHWLPRPNDNRLDHRPIENAETTRELAQRIYECTTQLFSDPDIDNLILISHGYASTFIIANWIGLPLDNATHVHFNLSTASITHLQQDNHFKNHSVKSLNFTKHLRASETS
ncbi:Putative phosphoserine phosphatase 2 [Poriferisphaera corsica]|uniref:Phosphoserine phosphatase 2 n=1 Tax=Poriferisphaera corsica TaxID=2528020 RepID=A0A517YV76_9BACT|nr:histidine phosphatase family protein [Poriferisphaera corsica]QDU34131.1 Putative phosphoserine phosphatase 2 [Poriferisphaera corsica]